MDMETMIRMEAQIYWVETKIQELFPWQSCVRCKSPDSPEDGSTHVDHFFDWVKETNRG